MNWWWISSSRRRQSGQVLPIAAAAFLVMCGLAGLAIDSSRDYLIKRNGQNAADFAVLAASKQMTYQASFSSPIGTGSPAIQAAHDFAAINGFPTIFSNGCDQSTGSSFSTTWFDAAGPACNATSGFTNKVTINSPPVALPGNPVPLGCQGSNGYSCVQVVITTRVSELFTAALGISYAYVTVAAAAQATLPSSAFSLPPPVALMIYQSQTGCDPTDQQCFDETKPAARTLLSCSTAASNCPTFWVRPATAPQFYGYDGSVLTPAGDYTTVQSNGDMVIQDRTTICDPYGGFTCSQNSAIGINGFAVPGGTKLYCSKIGGGGSSGTPCTTTGQPTLNEIDSRQAAWINPTFWYPTVDTSGLKDCGSLILNGEPVYGPCANASEPYLIQPGIYDYIVVNHGTYEFDTGLYDITAKAPVNTVTGAGYSANGIDHSKETAAGDWDLCTGGLPNSCPTLTGGVWIGHGGGAFSPYQGPVAGSCTGGLAGSGGGGGDATVISGSNVTFRFGPGSGGFVSTKEVTGLAVAGSGVGALASVGGAPLLFDIENNSFTHIDSSQPGAGTPPNQLSGLIYQTPGASAGGVEFDPSMNGQNNVAAIQGQILAYTVTTFGGSGGAVDFQNGYGGGSVPGIGTSGKNETSIISSVTLKAASTPGFSTLTVNYTDEWMMDAYDVYVKVNNSSPQFFSQGIWTTTPSPGSPLPPPNNNPSDTNPAYPSVSNPGQYAILSANDWSYTIPSSGGATIEAKGQWAWGHQSDIPSAQSGNYTAQLLYTFPNPAGSYISIALFALDGDHCGDYAYASYTFKSTGGPGPGQQTVGSVSLVQ